MFFVRFPFCLSRAATEATTSKGKGKGKEKIIEKRPRKRARRYDDDNLDRFEAISKGDLSIRSAWFLKGLINKKLADAVGCDVLMRSFTQSARANHFSRIDVVVFRVGASIVLECSSLVARRKVCVEWRAGRPFSGVSVAD